MLYTKDGNLLTGSTPEEIVRSMREMSLFEGDNDAIYMILAAERAAFLTGAPVRSTNAEEFLADLMTAGLIYEAPERPTQKFE